MIKLRMIGVSRERLYPSVEEMKGFEALPLWIFYHDSLKISIFCLDLPVIHVFFPQILTYPSRILTTPTPGILISSTGGVAIFFLEETH